jgi:2-polyprenyl-3-methyl-5-hydroxy-6-metoxy-1,4-benzoquinol methylase
LHGNVKRKQKIYELVREHVPATGKVLEVSCGKGEILKRLADVGYAVTGTNFTRYDDHNREVPIDWGVDLIEGLPYDDGTFECVILCDVLEHLSDHRKALSELTRVLASDGYLILSSPNIMRIQSRLHFLLTGFFKVKRAFIGLDVPLEKSFAFHNYPVHLPVLLYLLEANNVGCVDVKGVEYKLKSFLGSLILLLLLLPFTYYTLYIREKNIVTSRSSGHYFHHLLSLEGLCAENLIVVAKKGLSVQGEWEVKTALPSWSERHVGSSDK